MSESETPKTFGLGAFKSNSIYQRTSSSYPSGHGDVVLLTVDNTIFHVHHSVLKHLSPVFETIFENGLKADDEDTSSQPLKFEADANTLDLILAFAYPNRPSPAIDDVDTIASVFRAAKRYEMEGVLHQLRKCLLETRLVGDTIIQPLYIKAPLAVLVIAHAFDCVDEARFALRECLKGGLQDHITGAKDFDLPAELISTLLRLREDRMTWFMTRLDSIQWPVTNCFNCGRRFGEWKMKTSSQLNKKLEFEQLRSSVTTMGNCLSGHVLLTAVMQEMFASWIVEAKELEDSLPSLPRLSR